MNMDKEQAVAEALRAAAAFVLEYAGDIDVDAQDYAANITRKYPSIQASAIIDTDRHMQALRAKLEEVLAKLDAAGLTTVESVVSGS